MKRERESSARPAYGAWCAMAQDDGQQHGPGRLLQSGQLFFTHSGELTTVLASCRRPVILNLWPATL